MTRRRLQFSLVLPAMAVVFAVACADIFGVRNADTGDASVTGDGGGNDALPPYDANKDVISVGDANFAQCDGGIDDLTGAVFVSSSHPNRNTVNCGAATTPCSTIKIGIGVAVQTTAKKVVLANDIFDEVIELDQSTNGITIEGGYKLDYTQLDQNNNPAWVYQCATGLAQITPSSAQSQPYGVRIQSSSAATLRLMTVYSRSAKGYGESVFGVLVADSTATLDNVVVVAENGGDGANGQAGATNPPPFCGVDAGGGSGGSAGSGPAGNFGSTGYQAVTAQSGNDGDWGVYVPPQQGQCSSNCVSCTPYMTLDAGYQCATSTLSEQCGNFGTAGCNGARGLGGQGGGGGGATIALYIFGSSNVTLLNGTTFATSLGGNGGAGASGGNGQMGTDGGQGFSTTCDLSCGTASDSGCSPTSSQQLAGGPGGYGGQGGNGGTGGGGAGGPSYLVVRVTPAQLNGAVTSVNDAGPGLPGDGGSPNGGAGEQKSLKVYP